MSPWSFCIVLHYWLELFLHGTSSCWASIWYPLAFYRELLSSYNLLLDMTIPSCNINHAVVCGIHRDLCFEVHHTQLPLT
jgi:hypothetical protein